MNNYKFNLAWSLEDEGYIATCPEFEGLSAFGETAEEALAEAQTALKLFVETFKEKAVTLPEPETVHNYSGQFRVRLAKSLHAQAARLAAEDGISLNQFVSNAVLAKVSGEEVGKYFSEKLGNLESRNNELNTIVRVLSAEQESEISVDNVIHLDEFARKRNRTPLTVQEIGDSRDIYENVKSAIG